MGQDATQWQLKLRHLSPLYLLLPLRQLLLRRNRTTPQTPKGAIRGGVSWRDITPLVSFLSKEKVKYAYWKGKIFLFVCLYYIFLVNCCWPQLALLRCCILVLMSNYPEELTCFIYLALFTRILSSASFFFFFLFYCCCFLWTSVEGSIKAILGGQI